MTKRFLLFIVFLGLVYASPAQKNSREYLLEGQYEQPEFKKQQFVQEHLKEQQFLNTRNEKLLKNAKQQKNRPKVAMNAEDRAVLETFYNATGGDNWLDNTNWLTGDGSDWYGITLDTNGRVTEINLYSNQLSGSIPAVLGNLPNLQVLYLSNNQLSGSIPAELENLPNLQKLNLYSNQLSGNIPSELGNLTNLKWLNLGDNQLSGSIPSELGNLTNLQSLYTSYNQLSGSIPSELGNLMNLQSLYSSYNQLSGSIPSELGNLTNLQVLYLIGNQFTSLPDLSALVNLSPGGTGVQNNLLDFGDLESSGISWGSYAPQANVTMSKTETGGTITFMVSVAGTNNVYKWYKNDVEISGETENSLTVANTEDGIYYCEINNPGFPDLLITSVADGVGSVSLSNGVITNEYNVLIALYNTTNGDNWNKNTNWKTTEPVDYWHGVNVSGAHITEINLYSNQLSGSIPGELGNLTNLQWLGLDGNQLSGSIPAEIGNLTNLQWLFLESNQLSGSIPGELGNLTNLQRLYLSYNQLSGCIPSELGNLPNLQWLFLESNQLSGSIPAELGNLTNLQRFYLDGNQLTSLPDLSALVNLSSWGTAVQNNLLDFGDLETSGISWHYYAPQGKVGTEQNIELSEGESTTISVSVAGSNNSYQWYKDSTAIDGATDSEYTISNFTGTTDAGVYVCKITDSNYPDLTLESNSITVSGTSTTIDAKDDSQFSIYPNPVSDKLTVHFPKEKAELLKVSDVTGKQLFSRKVNSKTESVNLSNLGSGIYILQLEFENQIISKKIIKN